MTETIPTFTIATVTPITSPGVRVRFETVDDDGAPITLGYPCLALALGTYAGDETRCVEPLIAFGGHARVMRTRHGEGSLEA